MHVRIFALSVYNSSLIIFIVGFWKKYDLGKQQDAHEFLKLILERIQVEFQKIFRTDQYVPV